MHSVEATGQMRLAHDSVVGGLWQATCTGPMMLAAGFPPAFYSSVPRRMSRATVK